MYQTFRGSDVREALSAVKATLGPNAMIGSTRFVSNDQSGGLNHSYVEVQAAHPDGRGWASPFSRDMQGDAASPRRASAGRSFPRRARSTQPDDTKVSAGIGDLERRIDPAPGGTSSRSELASLEAELMALKAMLQDLHAARPPKEQAVAMLAGLGIEGPLARELANNVKNRRRSTEELREWLEDQISHRFRVSPGILGAAGKQVIACVGPTGVGKTTTLAKLAANARLDLGRSVSVISLDTFRVGAAEQWQRYAELMGLTVSVASNAETFRQSLRETSSDIVLVDTPGHVGKTTADWSIAQCLQSVTGRQLNTLLVLPAWLRAHDAERVTRDYDGAAPTALVTTKLDETNRIGGVLHGAALRDLPIAYLCNGPRVPEDLMDATSETLLAALFGRA